MSTCEAWEDERISRYIQETERHILPMAKVLRVAYEDEMREMIANLKFDMTGSA